MKQSYRVMALVIVLLVSLLLACNSVTAIVQQAADPTPVVGKATAVLPDASVVTPVVPPVESLPADKPKPATAAPSSEVTTVAAPATSAPDATEEPTPAPTPLPKEVTITNVFGYESSGGFFNYYYITGSVYNGTDTAINGVELILVAKDKTGKTVLKDDSDQPADSVTFDTLLYTINPGQTSPFVYMISIEDDGRPEDYEVTLGKYTPADSRAAKVEVRHDQMVTADDGSVYITGQLVNLGDTAVQIYGLAGAALDGDNQVVAANSYYAGASYLAPAGDPDGHDRTGFRINIAGPAPTAKTWQVYVDAASKSAELAANIVLSEPGTYVDAAGSLHLVGSATNNSDQPLEITLLATLYAADGTVLDADYTSLPYSLKPGESVTYNLDDFYAVDYVQGQAEKVASATVRVATAMQNSYEYVTLETRSDTQQAADGTVQFSGEVVNTSAKALSWATVVVAAYDAEGRLVATMDRDVYGTETSVIEPQGVSPYEVELQLPAGTDAAGLTFKIFVQGFVN